MELRGWGVRPLWGHAVLAYWSAPPLSSPRSVRAAARRAARFALCVRGLLRLRSAPSEPPDADRLPSGLRPMAGPPQAGQLP